MNSGDDFSPPGDTHDPRDIGDLDWLGGAVAQRLLAELAGQPESPSLVMRLRSRESLSPRRCAMLLEQLRVRQRAASGKSKFPKAFASRMAGTETGLEQATDAWLAAYKAERLVRRWQQRPGASPGSDDRSAGDSTNSPLSPNVADLCCGIGGDTVAMARLCRVTGVERDPYTAWCARWNLSEANRSGSAAGGSRILVADATALALGEYDVVHIDPDRRCAGSAGGEDRGRGDGNSERSGRTTFLGVYQPPRDALDRIINEHPCVVIKMAPGTAAPSEWARRAELEWISRDRECRQQLAWFDGLTDRPGTRRATAIFPIRESASAGDHGDGHDDGVVRYTVRTVAGRPGTPAPRGDFSEFPGGVPLSDRWIVEPDVAVLAADLTGEVADQLDAEPLTSDGAYLIACPPSGGDDPATMPGESPYRELPVRVFEPLERMPDDPSQLRTRLEQLDLGHLELKLRDRRLASKRTEADVHRAIFGRRLKLRGRGTAVLFVLETADGQRLTLLARRRPLTD